MSSLANPGSKRTGTVYEVYLLQVSDLAVAFFQVAEQSGDNALSQVLHTTHAELLVECADKQSVCQVQV
jgi:hypothetical protein